VSRNSRRLVSLTNALMTSGTVRSAPLTVGIGLVRGVAQTTGIDVAVDHRGRNRLRVLGYECWLRLCGGSIVTACAAGRELLTRLPQFLELMTGKTRNIGHPTHVDLDLRMAGSASARVELRVVFPQSVALTAR
jgi:hypothetical protein